MGRGRGGGGGGGGGGGVRGQFQSVADDLESQHQVLSGFEEAGVELAVLGVGFAGVGVGAATLRRRQAAEAAPQRQVDVRRQRLPQRQRQARLDKEKKLGNTR